jgi:hypothetical protein
MSEVYIFDSNGTATLEVANRRSEPAISAASDSAARKGDWSEMPLSCVSRDRDGDLLVTDWLIMKADQRTLALACQPVAVGSSRSDHWPAHVPGRRLSRRSLYRMKATCLYKASSTEGWWPLANLTCRDDASCIPTDRSLHNITLITRIGCVWQQS